MTAVNIYCIAISFIARCTYCLSWYASYKSAEGVFLLYHNEHLKCISSERVALLTQEGCYNYVVTPADHNYYLMVDGEMKSLTFNLQVLHITFRSQDWKARVKAFFFLPTLSTKNFLLPN